MGFLTLGVAWISFDQYVMPVDLAAEGAAAIWQDPENSRENVKTAVLEQDTANRRRRGETPEEAREHQVALFENFPVFLAVALAAVILSLVFCFRWLKTGAIEYAKATQPSIPGCEITEDRLIFRDGNPH